MFDHRIIIALCITCFFALTCGLRLGSHKKGLAARAAGLAGLGLAKLLLLALPLTPWLETSQEAHILARSGWSAWFAMLATGSQLVLIISGCADFLRACGIWAGGLPPEMVRAPFSSDTVTGLWERFCHPLRHQAGPWAGLAIFSATAIALHGASWGMAAWLALQSGLIALERLRSGRSLLPQLVPQPLRAVFVMIVFFLSCTMFHNAGLDAAWQSWKLMFGAGESNSYTYLLDARIGAPWPLWLMWLSVLSALFLTGLRRAASRHPLLSTSAGITLALAAFIGAPTLLGWPGLEVQKILTARFLYHGFQQGSQNISAGRDGWLYDSAELDRITRMDDGSGLENAVLSLQKRLAQSEAALLVVPMPGKLALNPEPMLPAKYAAPFQPHGLRTKIERLRNEGVHVMDPAQMLWDKRRRMASYFTQDSHWTPEAMKETALLTAKYIRQNWPHLTHDVTPMINASVLDRHDLGDLARSLAPEAARLFEAESCTLLAFQGLAPDTSSPVMLMGTSLLRVFDDPTLSFGNLEGTPQNAGFAAQLAALLARPLHVMDEADVINGTLSFADKRLVIWLLPAWRL